MPPQLGLPENASWHEALDWPGASQTGYVGHLLADLTDSQFKNLTPARELITSPATSADDILAFEADRYIASMMTIGRFWVYSGWGDAFELILKL